MDRSLNSSECLHGHQEKEYSLSILDGNLSLSFWITKITENDKDCDSKNNLLGELHSDIHGISNFTDESSSEK